MNNIEKELFEQMNMVSEIQRQAYKAGYEAGLKMGKKETEQKKFEEEQNVIADLMEK